MTTYIKSSGQNVPLGFLSAPWTDVNNYPSLTAAIASMGGGTLLIANPTILTSNTTIPSNIDVRVIEPGLINLSGHNLTINGPCDFPLSQIFSGSGNVSFGVGAVLSVKPEWWFSGSGYWDSAITSAIASISSGVVRFGSKSYQLNTGIAINTRTDLTFWGNGTNATSFVVNGNFNAFAFTGVCSRIKLKDLWIGSFVANSSGYGISVTGTSGVHSDHFYFDNVVIQNTYNGAVFTYTDSVDINNFQVLQSISGAMQFPMVIQESISYTIRNLLIEAYAGNFAQNGLILNSDTDSIMITESQVLGSATDNILLQNTYLGGITGPRLVRMVNVYSESSLGNGFSIMAGRDVRLLECHAAVNTLSGFSITGGTSVKIGGSLALQNGQHGFYENTGEVEFSDCTSSNNSQTTDNTYHGIVLASGSGTRVVGCRSGNFILSLANGQAYGMDLGATTDYLTISGNDLRSNKTAPLGAFSTGLNNQISGNTPNITSNTILYYGQMWYHNDSAPYTLALTTGTPAQIACFDTASDGQTLNGFSYSTSALTCLVAGTYKVNYSQTMGSSTSNHIYRTRIAINGVEQLSTASHTKPSNSTDERASSGCGIISLNVNDVVTIQMTDTTAGNSTATLFSLNVNLDRVGN